MDIEKINKELDELFELANNELKLAEYTGDKIIVTALNDLRNGTEHRTRASKENDDKNKIRELNRAKQHYIRAAFDALQSRVLFSMEKLNDFQRNFSKIDNKDNIAELIEANNTANDIKELLISRERDGRKYSDFEELQEKAAILDSNLNALSTNKEFYLKSISKSRQKARTALLSSIAGLIISVFAGFLFPVLFDRQDKTEISEQITDLDNIQNSLENLQDYVVNQKEILKTLDSDISTLNERKEKLELMLEIDNEKLELLLSEIENKKKSKRWIEILISFLVGVFSSTTVALVLGYFKRKTNQPSLDKIVTTQGASITKK